MAELLRSLQDSELIARFQRRCGLFPAPDEGPGAENSPADHSQDSSGRAASLQVTGGPGVGARAAKWGLESGGNLGSSAPLRDALRDWETLDPRAAVHPQDSAPASWGLYPDFRYALGLQMELSTARSAPPIVSYVRESGRRAVRGIPCLGLGMDAGGQGWG